MATYLQPDKVIKKTMNGKTITINQKIIPDGARANKYVCSYVQKGDLVKPNAKVSNGTGKPRGITVHNTPAINVSSATTMAEQYARATYPNLNMNGAMVHYYVSGYNAIWQLLNTDVGSCERGWHASDGSTRRKAHSGSKWTEIGGNIDCVSIESVGNSKEAEDATAVLVAYLCKLHGLNPKTDVYTHNYFMGLDEKIVYGAAKNCPVYILPHWNTFLSTVQKYYNGETTDSTSTGTSTSNKTIFNVGDVVQFTGTKHYVSSDSTSGSTCKPGKAKVTKVYRVGKSKHPYCLQYVSGGGSNVYGWVNVGDVKAINNKQTIKVGSKVKVKNGAKTYTGGSLASFVYNTVYTVISISGDRAVIGLNGVITAAMKSSDLIVQ